MAVVSRGGANLPCCLVRSVSGGTSEASCRFWMPPKMLRAPCSTVLIRHDCLGSCLCFRGVGKDGASNWPDTCKAEWMLDMLCFTSAVWRHQMLAVQGRCSIFAYMLVYLNAAANQLCF